MDALRRDHHRQRRRRRHAGPPPGAVRQADPAARARRLAAARAAELARAGRVRRQPLRLAGHLVRRQRRSRSSRRSTTSSAARRSSTAPRSTGCARRTSASCATTTGSRRPGRSRYDEIEPYYTQAEQLYQVHGARGEDPTEPPASAPYPLPGGLARAAHPAALRRPRGGRPPPVPRAVRDHARRAEHAVQRLRALRELRRLPVPRARQVRRRGDRRAAGARAPERHAADRTRRR